MSFLNFVPALVSPLRHDNIFHVVDWGTVWRTIRNSEYDQEIPQSQTTDKPMATQKSQDTRKTNHQSCFCFEIKYYLSYKGILEKVFVGLILIHFTTSLLKKKVL